MRAEQKNEGAVRPFPSLTNNLTTGERYKTEQRYKNYIPLDGFSASIIGVDFDFLLTRLDFYQPVNTDTGEIRQLFHKDGNPKRPRRRAHYKGLDFTYYPSYDNKPESMQVFGSFHKFWNHGNHNANDFNFSAFLEVLTRFHVELGIMPCNLHLTRLEWGLNLIPDLDANRIINSAILNRGNKEYRNSREYKHTTNRVCYYLEWEHKIYNKSEQYPDYSDNNTLRIEHKQKLYYKFCKKIGIGSTLHDLIESDFLMLKDTLLNDWERVLFVDPILDHTPEFYKYTNPQFWKDLNTEKRYQIRADEKKKLEQMGSELGGNCKQKILDLMIDKIESLNDVNLRFSYLVYIQNPIINTHYGLTG